MRFPPPLASPIFRRDNERVISLIVSENSASKRVVEKNGMRLEKETDLRGFLMGVLPLPERNGQSRRKLRFVAANKLLG
jgi:RimJ/RimL family protein N-acetyltransferase